MRKPALLFLLVYLVVCLISGFGFSAEPSDESSRIEKSNASAKPAKGEKETSLYLYYQKYLSPYFSGSQAKKGAPYKEPDQRGMLTASPSSGTLLSSKARTADGTVTKDGSQEQKSENGGEDKTYISLNKLDSVGLSELNKTFPRDNRKEYVTELSLGFKLTPMMDLLIGRAQKFERSENTPWESKNDGWRIRLQKEF